MIVERSVLGRKGLQEIDVEVVEDGLKLITKALTFLYKGQELQLAEDSEFTVEPDPDVFVTISAFLVRVKETDSIAVLVDEVPDGESPYVLSGSPYEVIHRIYSLRMPPATGALDGVEVIVRKLLAPEEEG